MSRFSGIWPALVTPFTEDNRLNLPVLRRLVAYLLEKGVDGLYVVGSTGQGLFLSLNERMQLVETVLAEVNGHVPVIVHVGAVAVMDAVTLARHACDVGASGISSLLLPQYPKVPDMVRYVEAICTSVPLPFLAYIYGRELDAVRLMQCLMQYETVIGAKYTGPNLFELKQVIELGQNQAWTVFSGMDEQSVFAAMTGAAGHIGSTLNFMPGVYRTIWHLVGQGNIKEAHSLQLRANTITSLLISMGFAGGLNVAMGKLGFECGDPRLPHRPLSAEQRQQLDNLLDSSEFAALVQI